MKLDNCAWAFIDIDREYNRVDRRVMVIQLTSLSTQINYRQTMVLILQHKFCINQLKWTKSAFYEIYINIRHFFLSPTRITWCFANIHNYQYFFFWKSTHISTNKTCMEIKAWLVFTFQTILNITRSRRDINHTTLELFSSKECPTFSKTLVYMDGKIYTKREVRPNVTHQKKIAYTFTINTEYLRCGLSFQIPSIVYDFRSEYV